MSFFYLYSFNNIHLGAKNSHIDQFSTKVQKHQKIQCLFNFLNADSKSISTPIQWYLFCILIPCQQSDFWGQHLKYTFFVNLSACKLVVKIEYKTWKLARMAASIRCFIDFTKVFIKSWGNVSHSTAIACCSYISGSNSFFQPVQ